MIEISASVLAADFSRLGADLRESFAAGACGAHVDVMDGQFAPNLSMGPEVLRAVRRIADDAGKKVAVHLMIVAGSAIFDTQASIGDNVRALARAAAAPTGGSSPARDAGGRP